MSGEESETPETIAELVSLGRELRVRMPTRADFDRLDELLALSPQVSDDHDSLDDEALSSAVRSNGVLAFWSTLSEFDHSSPDCHAQRNASIGMVKDTVVEHLRRVFRIGE